LTDDLSATLGLRYSHEEKDADRTLNISNYGTSVVNADLANDPIISLIQTDRNQLPHTISDSRTSKNFSPSFSVSYSVNDEMLVYASVSTAVKSGGFDSAGGPPRWAVSDEL